MNRNVAVIVALFALLAQPALGQEPPPFSMLPEQLARPSIAITQAMLDAKLVKTLPSGRRQVQFTTSAATAVPECLPDTPLTERCAYFVDATAQGSLARMHAPVDPTNTWWDAVRANYPKSTSGITDCSQVTNQRCVTLSNTASSLAWKQAWAACGTACTMIVMPGVYEVGYYESPFISNRASVRVIGVSDENGVKPLIRGKLTLLTNGVTQAYPTSLLGWGGTNRDLTLENIAFEHSGNCVYAGSRTTRQVIRLTDVDIRWCKTHALMIGYENAGAEDDLVYIHGGEFAYGGSNHTVYLDRSLYQEVIGARIHSPGVQHAIKAIGITINLIGNVFSSVKPDGTAQASPGLIDKVNLNPYAGGPPLSLIACQRGLIAYNTVVWRYDGSASGGVPAVRQPRKAVGGCDVPVNVEDPPFWASVAAQGLDYPQNATNRLALPMYWYANRFILLARDGTGTDANFYVKRIPSAFGIRNQSTYPVVVNPLDPGDWKPYPATPPAGWVERAYDYIHGNCFENFMPGNVPSDLLSATMKNPDGTWITPGERQWVLGDNTCAQLPPKPSWFPDLLPIMTRADYMAGQ
jgi:hypothetical protein